MEGQTVSAFFIRRAARIVPLAYLYLLVAFILAGPDFSTILQNLLFVENYTYAFMMNGHFWSLCVEVHFYIFIGFAFLLFGRRGVWLVPIACLAVTAARIWLSAYLDIQTHLRVDEICIGTCVAIAKRHGLFDSRSVTPLAFSGAALALALTSWPGADSPQYFRPYCGGALLAMALMLRGSLIREILVSPPAKYIAQISFALYVIHPLMSHGFMDTGSAAVKYLIKRPISLIATFALAHLSTLYFENRFISFAKQATYKRLPAS